LHEVAKKSGKEFLDLEKGRGIRRQRPQGAIPGWNIPEIIGWGMEAIKMIVGIT